MIGTGGRSPFAPFASLAIRARALVLLGAIALGAAGAACKTNGGKSAPSPPAATAPTVTIDTGGRQLAFRVEVAVTPSEHERGLMYRQRLDADAGMLFVFEAPRPQVFWMKNTYIPLDMLFIGADRRIVGIVENAVPETETPRQVGAPSQYVLEIGGGLSGRLGIRSGQQVEFRAIPSP
jgi:uncharacterized membrane protein (UPF0127 family)